MDDLINILMRRDTWEIIPRKSVADHNFLPGTWELNYMKKMIGISVNSRHYILFER